MAAGSVAATVQSMIGTVGAGSAFAALQSAGAAGMAASTQAIIGGVGAGIAGKLMSKKDQDQTIESVQDEKHDDNDKDDIATDDNKTDNNNTDNNDRDNNDIDNDNNGKTKMNELEMFMIETIKLPQYYEIFIDNGFETIEDILYVNVQDLIKMGIDKIGHQKRIMRNVTMLLDHKQHLSISEMIEGNVTNNNTQSTIPPKAYI